METVFWLSIVLVAYIYAGYPALVSALARVTGRPPEKSACTPSVTVIIAAYNEEDCIAATVQNKLDQDYPAERLQVMVVSDCSDDRTAEIVKQFPERVRLLEQTERQGKTAALNRGLAEIDSDIVIFSDANSMYQPDAIKHLVTNFADPSIGYVTGKMLYTNEDGSLVGDGCTTYMKYENWIRAGETQLASVIGVDGGIDAIRRNLYQPMAADQLPDFVLPMKVMAQGYRVAFDDGAILREAVLTDPGSEYAMRVRVSLRALWALWSMRSLLNPFKRPMLAWQIWSHKVLRYFAFVPIGLSFLSALYLSLTSGTYAAIVVVMALLLALAAVGWFTRGRAGGSLVGIPFYFALLNVACAHAFVRFSLGQKTVLWKPRQG